VALGLAAIFVITQLGIADAAQPHVHTKYCYAWTLICDREEVEAYAHGSDCYVLMCEDEDEDHIHGPECLALVCDLEETQGYMHGEDCFEAVLSRLICGLEERELGDGNNEEREHDADCYNEDGDLTCELINDNNEEHEHDADCYDEDGNLTCEHNDGEPGDGNNEEHEHDADCYDEDGNLICGEIDEDDVDVMAAFMPFEIGIPYPVSTFDELSNTIVNAQNENLQQLTILTNNDITMEEAIIVPGGLHIILTSEYGSELMVSGNFRHFILNEADSTLTIGEGAALVGNAEIGDPGGGVFINHSEATLLLIDDGRISNNMVNPDTDIDRVTGERALTYSGGGVLVARGTFNMHGGEISYNKHNHRNESNITVPGGGGAAFVGLDGTFNMSDGKIFENTSIGGAGGVHVGHATETNIITRGTFNMSGNATIFKNEGSAFDSGGGARAGGAGGVAVAGNGSVFQMWDNAVIFQNKGFRAGGVSIINRAFFKMEGGEISDNRSINDFNQESGGGVYLAANSTFDMEGGKISQNRADIGAGVNVQFSVLNMSGNAQISDNTALLYGGGVYVRGLGFGISDAKLNMYSGTISDNEATGDSNGYGGFGGGVYVTQAGRFGNSFIFTIDDGAINDNTAINGGGVYIHDRGTFEMKGGTIGGNTASGDGGGVYTDIYANVYISGGTIGNANSAINGGGVYMKAGTFDMNGGTILENHFTGNGGGVHMANGILKISGAAKISGHSGHSGGGIYINEGTLEMRGGTISKNTTKSDGGGVYINKGMFEMRGGTITGNTTENNGGGVYISANGMLDAENNSYITNNTAADFGGGIFTENFSKLKISSEVIFHNEDDEDDKGNKAMYNLNQGRHDYGARKLGEEGYLHLLGMLSDERPVVGSAQNILTQHVSRPGTHALNNYDINYNDTLPDWERLRTAIEWFTADTITIHPKGTPDNEEPENLRDGRLIIYDALASNNYINSDGTAINVSRLVTLQAVSENEEITLHTRKANDGRHFTMADRATFGFTNVILDGNEVAGGIYVAPDAETVRLSTPKIVNCVNDKGGAIEVHGSLIIDNGRISDNSAATDGGGVYVSTKGNLTINGTEVSSNEAKYGGGIYVDDGRLVVRSGPEGNRTKITDNIAIAEGGGIFAMNHRELAIEGEVTFVGNTAGTAYFLELEDPDHWYEPKGNADLKINVMELRALYSEHGPIVIPIKASASPGDNLDFDYLHNNFDINFVGFETSKLLYRLPETGGSGKEMFLLTGLMTMLISSLAFMLAQKRRGKGVLLK